MLFAGTRQMRDFLTEVTAGGFTMEEFGWICETDPENARYRMRALSHAAQELSRRYRSEYRRRKMREAFEIREVEVRRSMRIQREGRRRR